MKTNNSQNLDVIEDKITSLRNRREGLIRQLKKCRQNRSDLKKESRDLSSRISNEKIEIEQVYQHLEPIGQMRKDILAKIRNIRGRISETRRMNANVDTKGPKRIVAEMTQQLKDLEWKLQTERLTRDSEKSLVEQIRKTGLELARLQKTWAFKEETAILFSEINNLKTKLDELNTLRQSIEPKLRASKDRHNEMAKMRDQLQYEIEGVIVDITELQEGLGRIDNELSDLKEARRKLVEAEKTAEIENAKTKEAQLLEKTKKEVKEKIEEGKKLTFDEWLLAFRQQGEETRP